MTSVSLGDIEVRAMRDDELDAVCALQDDAFGADEGIGELLRSLRPLWCWLDDGGFVAEVGGGLAGHVQFHRAFVDAPERLVDVLLLSPVGVRSDLQGQGVGSTLIRGALEVVRRRPEPVVFLEGDPRYYGRFGFRPGAELGFAKPSVRIPDPAFQVLPLDNYSPGVRGALVYPDAFWQADAVGLR